MVNKLLLIYFLLFLCTVGYAQQKPEIEKRIEILKTASDESLLDSLNEIYYELYKLDPDYKLNVLKRLSEVYKERNHTAYLKCMCLYANNVNSTGYQVLDTAYAYAQRHKVPFKISYNLNKGNLFSRDHMLDSALVLFLEAKEIVSEDQLTEYVLVLHQIADVYYGAALYKEAREYYELIDSLKGDQKEYEFWRKSVIRNNLALIDFQTGNYVAALKGFAQSEAEKTHDDMSHGDSLSIAYYRMMNSKIYYAMEEDEMALENGFFAFAFFKNNVESPFVLEASITYLNALLKNKMLNEAKSVCDFIDFVTPMHSLNLKEKIALADVRLQMAYQSNEMERMYQYHLIYNGLNDSLRNQLQTVKVVKLLAEDEYQDLEELYIYEKRIDYLLSGFLFAVLLLGAFVLRRAIQVRKLNDLLRESNQTKDKLFSIVSHDLKSPFGALLGLSEILKEDVQNENYENIKMYSGGIYTKMKDLYAMMENLLTWSMSNKDALVFKKTPIKVGSVVDKALAINQLRAKDKNIEFQYAIKNSLQVIGDENTIVTVFGNLISNAIKFSYENGKIEITEQTKKNYVEVRVTDHGVGMTQNQIDEIMNQSLHATTLGTQNEKGTGLGLLVCKEFVDKNGGEFGFESTPGQGTTSWVRLLKA